MGPFPSFVSGLANRRLRRPIASPKMSESAASCSHEREVPQGKPVASNLVNRNNLTTPGWPLIWRNDWQGATKKGPAAGDTGDGPLGYPIASGSADTLHVTCAGYKTGGLFSRRNGGHLPVRFGGSGRESGAKWSKLIVVGERLQLLCSKNGGQRGGEAVEVPASISRTTATTASRVASALGLPPARRGELFSDKWPIPIKSHSASWIRFSRAVSMAFSPGLPNHL